MISRDRQTDRQRERERGSLIHACRARAPIPTRTCNPTAHTHTRELWGTKQTDPALPVTSPASHWLAVVQEERRKHKLECVRGGSVFALDGRCIEPRQGGPNVEHPSLISGGCFILEGLRDCFFFKFTSLDQTSAVKAKNALFSPVFYAWMERRR